MPSSVYMVKIALIYKGLTRRKYNWHSDTLAHTILWRIKINGSTVWSRANPGSSCHPAGVIVILLKVGNNVACSIWCCVDDSVTNIELLLSDQQQVVYNDAILIFRRRRIPANNHSSATCNWDLNVLRWSVWICNKIKTFNSFCAKDRRSRSIGLRVWWVLAVSHADGPEPILVEAKISNTYKVYSFNPVTKTLLPSPASTCNDTGGSV